MAITAGAGANIATGSSSNNTTLTVNITLDATANNYVDFSFAAMHDNPFAYTVTSCTIGGSAATLVADFNWTATGMFSAMYRRVGVTSGSVACTVVFSSAPYSIIGAVRSFFGVDQTTPTGTAVEQPNAGSPMTVAPSSAVGELVIDVAASDLNGIDTLTKDGTQTQQYNFLSSGGQGPLGGSYKAGAAGTVTMSWTQTVGDRYYAMMGVSLKPSVGEPPETRTIVMVRGG